MEFFHVAQAIFLGNISPPYMYISILHLFVLDVFMTLVMNADDYGYHNQETSFFLLFSNSSHFCRSCPVWN